MFGFLKYEGRKLTKNQCTIVIIPNIAFAYRKWIRDLGDSQEIYNFTYKEYE